MGTLLDLVNLEDAGIRGKSWCAYLSQRSLLTY